MDRREGGLSIDDLAPLSEIFRQTHMWVEVLCMNRVFASIVEGGGRLISAGLECDR